MTLIVITIVMTIKTITITIMMLNACTMNFLRSVTLVGLLFTFLLNFALYDSQIRNIILQSISCFYLIDSVKMINAIVFFAIAIVNVCIVFNIPYIGIVFGV